MVGPVPFRFQGVSWGLGSFYCCSLIVLSAPGAAIPGSVLAIRGVRLCCAEV